MSVAHSRGRLPFPELVLTTLLVLTGCGQMPEIQMPEIPMPGLGSEKTEAEAAADDGAAGTREADRGAKAGPAAVSESAVPQARRPEGGEAGVDSTPMPPSEVAAAPTVVAKSEAAAVPARQETAPVAVEAEGTPNAADAHRVDTGARQEDYSKLPPRTFVVHSVMKDRTHPYYGRGSRLGFSVNGAQGKALVVERGQRYVFRVDTDIQHDFYLARKGVGRGGFTIADGVKGNFIYAGEVVFTPSGKTPDIVYYACRNHAYMGGPIFVVDPGKPFDLARAEAEWRAGLKTGGSQGARRGGKASPSQARQKIAFARMFVTGSAVSKRIADSSNAEAKRLVAEARSAVEAAGKAFDAKDYGRALELADRAMKTMSRAGRLVPTSVVPDDSEDSAAKERFQVLLDGVATYRKSYLRNRKIFAGKKGVAFPEVDLASVDATVQRARKLADAGDYRQASELLTGVQTRLTEALSAMLKSKTLSYELVFETPKEEYEYELARYLSYEELVPLAIEQKRPSERMRGLMDKYVAKGKDIKAQALPVAASGDYKKAILMLQGATSQIRRALRIVGVR